MKTPCVLFVVVVAGVTALWAQDVVVVRAGMEKSHLDLSGFRCEGPTAAVFLRTLEQDLERSGWFILSRRAEGPLVLSGWYVEAGGTVRANARLYNRFLRRGYFENLRLSDPASEARRLAHRLADAIVRAVRGVPGIASTRIAFVGRRGSQKNLYMCDADGDNVVQVTHDDGICLSPSWAPDKNNLFYMSFARGFPDIFRIDLVAKRRYPVARFPGLNACAAVSPDGTELAVILSKDGNVELYVLELSRERKLQRLTRTPHAAEASPSWAPDGKRLVYVSDASGSPHLYLIGRHGGEGRRITFVGRENVAPDWGPNGLIAYSSRRGGKYVIYVLDPATQVERQISATDADYEDPSWAPDGRHLVCIRKANFCSELYILDTMGDDPIRLSAVPGEWCSPAWSPK